jgi:hypothetical protein
VHNALLPSARDLTNNHIMIGIKHRAATLLTDNRTTPKSGLKRLLSLA